MPTEPIVLSLPVYWASYFAYADATDLTDTELADIADTLRRENIRRSDFLDSPDESRRFSRQNDASGPSGSIAGDVTDYYFRAH